jgi:hypothetical protein
VVERIDGDFEADLPQLPNFNATPASPHPCCTQMIGYEPWLNLIRTCAYRAASSGKRSSGGLNAQIYSNHFDAKF